MLSVEKCREILGCDSPESDADLELLRNQLYGVARVAVETCPRQRLGNGPPHAPDAARQAIEGAARVEAPSKPTGFPDALAMLPADDRYDVEERTAIMEFDGGLDRDAAERAAFSFYWWSKHRGN